MTQPEAELVTWVTRDGTNEHRFTYYLAGMRGTVQFMYLSYDFNGELREMGADIGYHSPRPLYPGQRAMALPGDCHALRSPHKQATCYYDGSGLAADRLFKQFRASGNDEQVIWQALRDWYFDTFYDGNWEAGHVGEPYQTEEERSRSMLEGMKMIRDSGTMPVTPDIEELIDSMEKRLNP